MSKTILAVGAAGKFGGLVVPALADRGATVRGFVRDGRDGDAVRAQGASDIAVGDLGDPTSVRAALVGVDAVFYIAPVALPDEAKTGMAFVAAAIHAGVKRFVFSSVIAPVLSLPNHASKAPVEDAVLNSHLEYSFLHPGRIRRALHRQSGSRRAPAHGRSAQQA